ncbi:MAG TPA: lipoprotein [Burkholderiales bacterium]|nr:lipoprotein [Burkholderiales bacterium]
MRPLAFLLLLAATMQGCGQKGPLYIPTPEQLQAEQERQRRLEERARREAQGLNPAQQPAPASPMQGTAIPPSTRAQSVPAIPQPASPAEAPGTAAPTPPQ